MDQSKVIEYLCTRGYKPEWFAPGVKCFHVEHTSDFGKSNAQMFQDPDGFRLMCWSCNKQFSPIQLVQYAMFDAYDPKNKAQYAQACEAVGLKQDISDDKFFESSDQIDDLQQWYISQLFIKGRAFDEPYKGLSESTLAKCGVIKYSPSIEDKFEQPAVAKHFGVVSDRFQGYALFPCPDLDGKIRGFTARSDENKIKFISFPDEVKHPACYIDDASQIFITEGVLDVCAFVQAGVSAVGLIGVRMPASFLDEFKRFKDSSIVICFDNEDSGIGNDRARELQQKLWSCGFDCVHIWTLPKSPSQEKIDFHAYLTSGNKFKRKSEWKKSNRPKKESEAVDLLEILGDQIEFKPDLKKRLQEHEGMFYYHFPLMASERPCMLEIKRHDDGAKKHEISHVELEEDLAEAVLSQVSSYNEHWRYSDGEYSLKKAIESLNKPSSVTGYEVYKDIKAILKRYCYYKHEGEYIALALYPFIHLFTLAFSQVPYLHLTGIAGSGKSRTMSLLHAMTPFSDFYTASISEAFYTHSRHQGQRMLLLDEAEQLKEQIVGGSGALGMLLNAGYKKGAKVPKISAADRTTRMELDVYGCIVLGSINILYDTLSDRSLTINHVQSPVTLDELSPHFKESELAKSIRDKLSYLQIRHLPFMSAEYDTEKAVSYVRENYPDIRNRPLEIIRAFVEVLNYLGPAAEEDKQTFLSYYLQSLGEGAARKSLSSEASSVVRCTLQVMMPKRGAKIIPPSVASKYLNGYIYCNHLNLLFKSVADRVGFETQKRNYSISLTDWANYLVKYGLIDSFTDVDTSTDSVKFNVVAFKNMLGNLGMQEELVNYVKYAGLA